MAFKFVFLVGTVALSALMGIVSAEFDYNPELYNGNNNNNNNNNNNVNTYSDSVQHPANSYSAPLTALNGFNNNNNNAAPQQQQQQQQQSTSNGYNYNANNLPTNNYNNNAAPPQQQQQQQQQKPQPQQQQQNNYANNNGVAQNLANGVPTPAGYDYTPQNLAALSSSSSSSSSSSASSVGTFGRLQTSFSAQAHQSVAPVEEYNPPAKYDYSYNVHNEDTNDIKSHAEARDGYFVQGSYTVVDPDGFQRTVSYTVDGPSGFNAVVNRVPYALKPLPTLRTPASTAAPIVKLAELPLGNGVSLEQSSGASASATVAEDEQKENTDTTRIDLPVQPSDSYLTPPADSRDGKGPYQ